MVPRWKFGIMGRDSTRWIWVGRIAAWGCWSWSITLRRIACAFPLSARGAKELQYALSSKTDRGNQGDKEEPRLLPARGEMGTVMPYNVLLVDDHKLMRDGVKTILERVANFKVMAEAENGTDAVQACKKLRPDIVLMDIGLPGMNGIEATEEILRHCPGTRIVILSMYDDENSVVSAIRSGARAFVLKKASSNDLLDALRTVAKGGSYLSSQVSDRLLTRIQRGDLEPKDRPLEGLSPRELQVLRLVAEGKTSKDIAVMLDLGLQTVRSYRKTMMKKLGVNNVAGLTQLALSTGLTHFDKPDADTVG